MSAAPPEVTNKEARALALQGESKDRERPSAEAPKPITQGEANLRARRILKEDPDITRDDLARAIPCSAGMASQLPAWRAVSEKRRAGHKPKVHQLSDIDLKKIPDAETQTPEHEAQINELAEDQAAERKADARRPRRPRRESD